MGFAREIFPRLIISLPRLFVGLLQLILDKSERKCPANLSLIGKTELSRGVILLF